jgi:hypothetical protein
MTAKRAFWIPSNVDAKALRKRQFEWRPQSPTTRRDCVVPRKEDGAQNHSMHSIIVDCSTIPQERNTDKIELKIDAVKCTPVIPPYIRLSSERFFLC